MDYDVLIIGGGPAGYTAAIQAAKQQLKVALIEKDKLGGTCLNKGCIPTKALLHSAKTYQKFLNSKDEGLNFTDLRFDPYVAYQRKDQIVEKLVNGIDQLIKANKIDLFTDQATLVDDHHVRLIQQDRLINADKIIIATGARPIVLPIVGSELDNVFTSDGFLASPILLNDILIVGGGVIGCELATYFYQLGHQVTIIELANRILSTIERELASNLQMILKKNKVNIITNAKISQISQDQKRLVCTYIQDDEQRQLSTEAIIFSIGRKPNTEDLNLDKLQITTERGYIKVNENYQTNIPNIYAIGDVNGGVQLAHVASSQGIDCIMHIVDKPLHYQGKSVPYCIYTNPEVAYVGLSEDKAKELKLDYQVSKFITSNNGRYLIENNDRGFVKVIFVDDVIKGASLFMDQATEYIVYFANAIDNKLTYRQLTEVIFPHPTISESIKEALENIHDQAIHVAPLKR